MKNIVFVLLAIIGLFSCKKEEKKEVLSIEIPEKVKPKIEFGFNLDNYIVDSDTVRSGDSFGKILFESHIGYGKIEELVKEGKDTFDVKRLQIGKKYTVLKSKDSLERAQVFIYQPNKIEYTVFDFSNDSISKIYNGKKPVKLVEKEASGVITSSLSEAMDKAGLNVYISHELADIYAWSIDFFRLQKGDKYKIIYTEKYINDSIYAGVKDVKAAIFEHNGTPFYAFDYKNDTIPGIMDYYDEEGKTLRSQFLKAPVKFSRISSRYNLKRRIAYYGNRVRPHRGTDFAAPIGTPILATASGTVTESTRRGGNGKYVKIRHNSTYSTQYLHMSRRAVKVGDVVKQGDVIGYIGMTGNTGGPHVCYRFWKNGRQVDPLREKLPAAKPIKEELKAEYLSYIQPLKEQLDNIQYPQDTTL
ncbi:M23 family metallopeptidase [Pseudofulvibacter geojedonensis]|uniref:Peptidoglycan DD-metalloendopeptidase family protein n=1 Tax=Pseudofulvibacter geojedonensis TaxID=1123758 RepID=A0ABW3I1H2_9FLAO